MALIQKIRKKRKQKGYTVIEVMIVLSVSTLLVAAAIAGYARQNSKTEFTNAVRSIEVVLQGILNDVSTGYYPSSNDFTCIRQGSPAVPVVHSGVPAEQGTNQDCLFLGKAIMFSTTTDDVLTAYTIIGLRNKNNDENNPATNVDEAANRLLTIDGTFDVHDLHAGIDIQEVVIGATPGSPARVQTGDTGFVVVSGFGHGELGGAGATTNQVIVSSLSPDGDKIVNAGDLNNRDITICLQEPGGGRQASITIGAGARTNIETMIDGWADVCD